MTQRIDDIINGYVPPQVQQAVKEQEIAVKQEAPEEIPAYKGEDLADREAGTDNGEGDAGTEDVAETAKPIKEKSETVEITETPEKATDEYGIEVPKARTYTEDEVQRMIRDRLSRGANAQPAVQQHANIPQVDTSNLEPWQLELKQFVKGTLEEVTQDAQIKQRYQEERERQTNFEVKFTTGMEKFSDFKDVVGKLPITDSMMMSIRDMDNPATFIYAAAKLQPKEIERIASLSDPYQQAKEMGRLDERMRKAKNVSQTAVPLKSIKSDVSNAVSNTSAKKSIDSLIQNHAKSKLNRR